MPQSAKTLNFVYSSIYAPCYSKFTEYIDDPYSVCVLACTIHSYIWIPFCMFDTNDIGYMLSRHKEDYELHSQIKSNIFFRAKISHGNNGFVLSVQEKFTKKYIDLHVHTNWPYMFCPIADPGIVYYIYIY
jgi:hypothetical protein